MANFASYLINKYGGDTRSTVGNRSSLLSSAADLFNQNNNNKNIEF